ncbi:hypothetical protein RHMOL_Rhmol12G0015600 [Rhododendron molle]|uniref:Uncharacterized protein n=1 Tax=Rhododendron molle TaxID=49168 RepID=A0ACC0LDP1_RHOML|nr:hypothetical protein RHMOL_Rhmol12G0015600 [Rhododendron molle]
MFPVPMFPFFYLPLLEDIDKINGYAWGASLLVNSQVLICKVVNPEPAQTDRSNKYHRPAKLGKSRTVLLSFEKAVYHQPDLSPRQFGLGNEFVCKLSTYLIEIKLCERSGKSSKDWSSWGAYKLCDEEWRKRYNLLIEVGEEAVTHQPSKNQGAESPRRSYDTVICESPYEHFYEPSEGSRKLLHFVILRAFGPVCCIFETALCAIWLYVLSELIDFHLLVIPSPTQQHAGNDCNHRTGLNSGRSLENASSMALVEFPFSF